MVRRTRRFRRRRFRTRRRYTRRRRYPRGAAYRRRAMSNTTLTSLVKRLYKINEVKQIRSDIGFPFTPTSAIQALSNCYLHPLQFPIPLASGLTAESDSTFEGNTFQPISLKVRIQISMNGTPNETSGFYNYTYGGWIRQIIYQVKSGRTGYAVNTSSYHELAAVGAFNNISLLGKMRILGSPATSDVATLATNYHNEPTSPLRVGIRGLCRILSDKRWTFSSHGRQAIASRFRTRKPSQVKYTEVAPENAAVVDDGNEVTFDYVPQNQIYVMYIVNFDQATITNLAALTPTFMVAANYELAYRDA